MRWVGWLAWGVVAVGCGWAGETITKDAGGVRVGVRVPEGGLFAGEVSVLAVRVTRRDAEGREALVGGARVEAAIDMPSMAGMPVQRQAAHAEGVTGEYSLEAAFPHGGDYRMRLRLSLPDGVTEEVEFALGVGDEAKGRPRRPAAYRLELSSEPARPRAGEPAELRMRVVRASSGETVRDFEVMHERLLHLIVVRSDLGRFAHEHPVLGEDGTFRLRHAFPTGGAYRVFADMAPREAGAHIVSGQVEVEGELGDPYDVRRVERPAIRETGSLRMTRLLPSGPAPVGEAVAVAVALRDRATGGEVADLEPYLGAMGHLMLVHEDGATLVHSHPDERQAQAGRSGRLFFVARFPKAGMYRGWVQVQRGGRVVTGDFAFEAGAVEP